MALQDLELFLQERIQAFNNQLDVSPGSPVDVQVIQPILRRLGTDPFTTDIATFIQDRLTQEFPDLALKQGDAVTDLLVKPAVVLWDPIIREVQRVKNMLSFRDPASLTIDEAEALGANLFATRKTGDTARGVVRIYFAAPQNITISQANFVTSRQGLNYFPTSVQSISTQEMLINKESSLYYFDINVVAESTGDAYNIGPDEIVTIANVLAAVRLTNKSRFRFGLPEEDAVTYAGRIDQELTERSMVTLRGITARLIAAFSDITRIGIVGFNDPEMQRDILEGGGLGPILKDARGQVFAGVLARAIPDGENQSKTRRVTIDPVPPEIVDFTAIATPPQLAATPFVLTLQNAFGALNPPFARDIRVLRVVNTNTLDLEEQVLDHTAVNCPWVLRRNSLTLSKIPGGILFPDGANGTVELPDGVVHIGGTTDVHVRGNDFDQGTLVLSDIVDDQPLLQGVLSSILTATTVQLGDLVLGVNYAAGDATDRALTDAVTYQYTLQIREGLAAGSYRILAVSSAGPGTSPVFTVASTLPLPPGTFRWRLTDELEIEMVEPKETRVSGADLQSIQSLSIVTTGSGTDFKSFGVAQGDVLRVLNGLDAGDYTITTAPFGAFFTSIQVDRPFTATTSNLQYTIFRKNTEGGIKRPLIRLRSIDLLDTSAQPVGSSIPYARPLDGRSTAFVHSASGVKVEVKDATLGIVGLPIAAGPIAGIGAGDTIQISWPGTVLNVAFAVAPTLAQVILAINAAAIGVQVGLLAVLIDGNRLGIIPPVPTTTVTPFIGNAFTALFGAVPASRSSKDIRSTTVETAGGWAAVLPPISKQNLDVVQVLDGFQAGFYGNLNYGALATDPLTTLDRDFGPEAARGALVGSRSLGRARMYFSEPTSIEFDSQSRFSVVNEDGETLRFLPDPTRSAQLVPGLPAATKPQDGAITLGANTLSSATIDFISRGIKPGDQVVVDFQPIPEPLPAVPPPVPPFVDLLDPVPGLALQSLLISLDDSPFKVITFINDIAAPGAVSRAGVADQINTAVGEVICSIKSAAGGNYLVFSTTKSLTIKTQVNGSSALPFILFNPAPPTDINNNSPAVGTYTITAVPSTNSITVTPAFPGAGVVNNQQFKVFRPGTQRFGSTLMSAQQTSASLYYIDVNLVSEGTGALWDISADLRVEASNYRSDGYYLTTKDPNLTFSDTEEPLLHLSKSIIEVGADDEPENSTQLAGQNIQLNYDYAQLVSSVQNFTLAETERVVNESPLARHLIPHFVRVDILYVGGSAEKEVLPDIERYVRERLPGDPLESSDLQKIISDRGATYIQNPLDIVAIVIPVDRKVYIERSSNRISTGRLHAFIPDQINLTRKSS